MIRTLKIRVCYKCKEFVRIFEDDPIGDAKEKAFTTFHPKHPTQIVRGPEAEALIVSGYSEFNAFLGGRQI